MAGGKETALTEDPGLFVVLVDLKRYEGLPRVALASLSAVTMEGASPGGGQRPD